MTNYAPEDNLAEWDAAYVLGALSLQDRLTYEDYLAANPARAAELTQFAGMPGILNALSHDEAVALTDLAGSPAVAEAPDNVASLAQAAAKRQHRSRRTALVAAVVAAAGGDEHSHIRDPHRRHPGVGHRRAAGDHHVVGGRAYGSSQFSAFAQ